MTHCLSSGNSTVDELMMRLMGAMEIFTAQQQEDIKDEVRFSGQSGGLGPRNINVSLWFSNKSKRLWIFLKSNSVIYQTRTLDFIPSGS